MNKMKYIFTGILSLLLFSGCLDNYREVNTDPELLVTVNPKNAFTGATENFNNSSRQHLLGKYSGVMQYMQYIVAEDGAQEGAYVNTAKNTRPSPYTPYYRDYYAQIGLRLKYLVNNVIPNNPEKDRYQHIVAIANILETYQVWLMFDVYGAAPYTEAFKINEGIRTPKYELYQKGLDGKELYKVFDEKIKQNIEILQKESKDQYKLDKNDYFYQGDVNKWIKFGNTLRIKMAQRLEKADNAFYKSVLKDALANSGGLISKHDESCIYHHPNEHNNNTDDMQGLTTNYVATRALVNFLKAYDDPRLPILIRRNGFGKGNNNKDNDAIADTLAKYFPNYQTQFAQWTDRYVGMAANPDSTNSLWSTDSYFTISYKNDKGVDRTMTVRNNSQIESRFYVKNGGKVSNTLGVREKEDQDKYDVSQNEISLFTPLITYPEVCLMMAEIAYKENGAQGGKDALAWFHEGIRASMEQYQSWAKKMGVPSAMNEKSDNYHPITKEKIDQYIARAEFQNVSLEKIISQQWVNLFMRPEEAWATWKRTGLPAFKDQPVPDNGVAFLETIATGGDKLLIPRRCVLPTPNMENVDNFNMAVKELTTDPNYGSDENKSDGRIWWDKK
ncbi:SusD/RagB family nutrient-binding outer membrane lipoprotein [Tannerella forsythia]|uniref:SusD/RagB family nutrient-binding outer membrane lipoprotein n=1 Tax=Tannerella forsythia TaxID=28112 RepID=A0A2A6E738_TANFO|nr:SusD/RagB family nutrient-binding outer membrane lipoprotein [Tannerella forsythia]PDP43138.1 SusD/RagB family nutrient-binding outer membrane lipoprotein [Tannerella forsythia]